MTKLKRLVAVVLAVLMMLGSLSMVAFADDSTNPTLGIETKIFRNVDGEWIQTEKVKQGETVKARVYLDTNYYTNSGNLLFFYNNSFFSDSYPSGSNTLTVNPVYVNSPYTITGTFVGSDSSSVEKYLQGLGAIDSDFADEHEFFYVSYIFDGSSYNQKFDGNKWFCEFELTVNADASGAGDLFAVEKTTLSPSFPYGRINVPKGEYNEKVAGVTSMANFEAALNYTSNPVTLYNNVVKVTFDANKGEFADGTTTKNFEGESGTELVVPEPAKTKFNFKGWTVKDGDGSIVEIEAYPAVSTDYVAVWEEIETDKEALHLETKFYRLDSETNEWVYTEKAKRGEALKARIFVDTSYYTNAGDIIVFFDNQFFTETYNVGHNELKINKETGSAVTNGVQGSFAELTPNSLEIKNLVDCGYITSSFAAENTAFTIEYSFDAKGSKFVVNDWQTEEDGTVKVADDSDEWIFEFDLQVSPTASGEDYFWIEPKTIMNPDDGSDAYINIPLSKLGDENINNTPLFLVDVDETVVNNPVSLETSITLDANEGTFAENDADILVLEGWVGDTVIAPEIPTKDGFTFMGWVDENGDAAEIPETMPYEEITLTAVWQPQVNISFDTDGDVDTPADIIQTETSGQPFEAPANPSKDGYEFVGWTKDDTLSTFTDLDDVCPDTDTTYYALYEEIEYTATYYVRNPYTLEFELVAEVPVAYGNKVPAVPSNYKAPEGYSPSAKSYTNGSLTAELPANATMPVGGIEIYFKLVPNVYDVIFDANEGAWADGSEQQTVKATYDAQITAPEDPARDGYVFTGWDADVGIMTEIGKVFYATWDEATYNAVYKVDDAVYETYPTEYGEVIDIPAEPYKEGYTFKGWTNYTDGMTMPAKDVEFIAVFDINVHDATFDPGEGGWETVDENGDPVVDENGKPVIDSTDKVIEDIKYNDPIEKPADPVKEGYVFGGWDPIPDTMPDKDTTYTATWNPATDTPYKVEFYTMETNGVDYKLTDTQNKTGTTGAVIDLAITPPTNFSIDTEQSTYDDKVTIAADGSTVVTVYYARDSYTIIFDGNEGTVNNEASISNVYYYGASVAVPATNRTGYTFTGWKDADGEDVTVNITATADATYIAQWKVNQYTIKFDTDGGTTIDPITDDFGKEIPEVKDPTKEGYTFVDWVGEDDKPADVPTTMPAEDTNLKATWEINYYDISLDAEGGKLANGNETYAAADVAYATDLATYGVPMGEPTKTGYTFLGWSETEGSETAEIAAIPATMPADDIIYYAVWDINEYTITFDTDGGSEIAPITQDYDTTVKDPGKPTKEGHTFDKWVDEEGKEVSVPATMPSKDVTLKATWTVNKYEVTYVNDEVTVEGYPTDVEYGDKVPAPAEMPTKTGYTFGGWIEETSKKQNTEYTSMPAENLKFVAKWNNIQGVEYYFDVYKMGVDGKYPDEPERSVLTGEIDADVTVGYTAPNGFKIESSKLNGTIEPDETLILYVKVAREEYDFVAYLEKGSATVVAEGTYLYEAPVASVETPENPGYVFDGWVYEDGSVATIPTSMPANDVTVYATWVEDEFTASFDAGEGAFPNDEKVVTDNVTFGEDIEAPAQNPIRDGYDFVGWAPADIENPTEDDVVTDYGKMDEDGEDFQAVWVKKSYTVNFYDYVPADGDERQTPMNAELVIVPSPEYDNGEKIIFPSTADLYEYDHYIFKGWTDAEGVKIYTDTTNIIDTENVIAGTALVNGTDGSINFYAVYERVKVMLIPEQSPVTPGFEVTTIIDRDGGTVDDYVDGTSVWFVYGLQTKLKETKLLNDYIDVQGDGRIEIKYRKKDDGSTFAPYTGTGTVINVYDNVTDELVESFYIVIFGDLDGDSYIKSADAAIADEEALGYTYWSKTAPVFKEYYSPFMHKAADVGENLTGKIDTADALIIEETALGYCFIDQTNASVIEIL